jgi:hypothetical protein
MKLDLNSTKKLFNYILDNDYEIILDKNHNDIMYIKHNNGEIKCKYVLIFSTINEKNNEIIWSYDNQYIDRKTREISKILKKEILVFPREKWTIVSLFMGKFNKGLMLVTGIFWKKYRITKSPNK